MVGETRLGQTGRSAVSQVQRCYRFVIQNASFFHAGRNIVSGNEASRAGRRRYRAIFWPTLKFRTRYRFRIPHHSIGAAQIAEQAVEFERP